MAALFMRGYGATVARLTPDQTVGRSNRSGLILNNFSIYMFIEFSVSLPSNARIGGRAKMAFNISGEWFRSTDL